MRQLRILLVDDMTVIRQGLRMMLKSAKDIVVVGEAVDGDDAVRQAFALKPDVVLMDQDMPQSDGIEATRSIKKNMPGMGVVIMTDHLDDSRALQSIEAGATGYILKDIPAENLATVLRYVCNGHAFLQPEITGTLIDRFGKLMREMDRHGLEAEGLTRRQLEILIEVAKGSTYSEIAKKLVVTDGTIKTHVHNILGKLHLQNRTQLAVYVLRKGLIK